MAKMIKVNFRNLEIKEFLEGTSLLEISKYFSKYFNYPILIARVDNNLKSLSDTLSRKCDIDFYDRSHGVGSSVYSRTLQLILIKAVKNVLGNDVDVVIEYSIDKGFYVEVVNAELDKPILKMIDESMHELVNLDLIITKTSVTRHDAISYFKSRKQNDKVKSLKYNSNTFVTLYRLDDMYDYFYGEMAYSTGAIDEFKLTYIKDNGFVVSYPDIYNPECTLDYIHHQMLFDTFLKYSTWGHKVNIRNASDLNEFITTGDYVRLIRLSEAHYNGQISKIADTICDNRNIRLVLVAGPSSSGKTTTSKKLEISLQSKGVNTHQISLDDYYIDREKTIRDANGEFDFENIKALDLTLFNKHISKLLDGGSVDIPSYNFVVGKREYHGNTLKIGENDVLIVEGIHALNEELTAAIERKYKYKIYISPLTQLNIDNHNRVHTSDTRKLRRIIRDNKYRGNTASDTLSAWKRVREGEEKYIFPYQDDADVIINSALLYEFGILKIYAEPLLYNIDENDKHYPEAIRLINLLRCFLPIPSDEIPSDSILREFIGGSCFYEKD